MIEVLKQALDALEFFNETSICSADTDISNEAITSLQQAIAELESQEPVAWRWKTHNGYAYSEQHYEGEDGQPLYTHPPQRTEQNFCPRCGKRTNDIHTCTPPQGIYYTPPQRKPLTDEQAYDLFGVHYNMSVIRNVEAAHGIKGET